MCGKIKIPLRKSKNEKKKKKKKKKKFRSHASVIANKNFRTRKRHVICGKMARGTPCYRKSLPGGEGRGPIFGRLHPVCGCGKTTKYFRYFHIKLHQICWH
jgi:hypothetical protein